MAFAGSSVAWGGVRDPLARATLAAAWCGVRESAIAETQVFSSLEPSRAGDWELRCDWTSSVDRVASTAGRLALADDGDAALNFAECTLADGGDALLSFLVQVCGYLFDVIVECELFSIL